MKKLKVIVVALSFCLVFFTGCMGVSSNIRLAPTNISAADFLARSLNEVSFINQRATEQLGSSNNSLAFDILSMYALSGQSTAINVVSTIDFCIEIADQENSSGIDQKIYEYTITESQDKCVVFVSKVAGKSNVFNASQYVVDADTNFADIVASGTSAYLENQFTISRDKSSGGYSFSDTDSDVVGEFVYNADGGHMGIEMSYMVEISTAETLKATMDFYNYTNGVLGGRFVTEASIENQKQNIIFEYLAKQFDKRAKIGVVKDQNDYVDMKATEEIKIAAPNAGDYVGYAIVYINNSDSSPAYTTATQYGLEA